MITNAELLYEYERVLVEKKRNLNVREISEAEPIGTEASVSLLRYVFEKMLHWTPEQAFDRFDMQTAKELRLDRLVESLRLPEEMKMPSCCFYSVVICYPDRFSTDLKSRTLMVYDRVLNRKSFRFPENFFDGVNGRDRLDICMEYAAERAKKPGSRKSVKYISYEKICRFLKKNRLLKAVGEYFEGVEEITEYASQFLK